MRSMLLNITVEAHNSPDVVSAPMALCDHLCCPLIPQNLELG